MDSFTVAFWKDPVSKDDSTIELHEAGLVHAIVSRTSDSDNIRYAVDVQDAELKVLYGRIVLSKTLDNRWKVVNALNSIEDIFVQLTAAIDNAELTLSPNVD
ncbi:MAG: hypothetical protein WCF67_06100 [Chitinophagaceae bacterium]